MEKGAIKQTPIREFVAAISVGIGDAGVMLDLDYVEDSSCETDMNVVMTGSGMFIEIQGTAEGVPFTRAQSDQMLALAETGICQLIAAQRAALAI
jgi:ribonuclease PH